jgi:hypothetical protein
MESCSISRSDRVSEPLLAGPNEIIGSPRTAAPGLQKLSIAYTKRSVTRRAHDYVFLASAKALPICLGNSRQDPHSLYRHRLLHLYAATGKPVDHRSMRLAPEHHTCPNKRCTVSLSIRVGLRASRRRVTTGVTITEDIVFLKPDVLCVHSILNN